MFTTEPLVISLLEVDELICPIVIGKASATYIIAEIKGMSGADDILINCSPT